MTGSEKFHKLPRYGLELGSADSFGDGLRPDATSEMDRKRQEGHIGIVGSTIYRCQERIHHVVIGEGEEFDLTTLNGERIIIGIGSEAKLLADFGYDRASQ